MFSTANQDDLRNWLSKQIDCPLPKTAYCLAELRNNQIAGVIGFTSHINKSIWVHIAGLNKTWLTSKLLYAFFDYPFNQLGCTVMIAQICSSNRDSRQFAQRLGFKTEAIIKDAHQNGDLVLVSMLRENCRYINKRLELEAA